MLLGQARAARGSEASGEAPGSPGPEQKWRQERATAATPHGQEEVPPTARLPDRPRLPFYTAHHLEFLQVPETDGPAEKARPHAGLSAGRWLGKPPFLETLAHPPTRSGPLLSMWEVDICLRPRHPSKAQDTGAGELESG